MAPDGALLLRVQACTRAHTHTPTQLSWHEQVKPLEEAFKFGNFFSPLLSDSDFEAKPSVLLLGQYSTGAHQHAAGLLAACVWCNAIRLSHCAPPASPMIRPCACCTR